MTNSISKNKKKIMQEQKQQLVTRLKESTNVLITVSNNPSVDQLAAAIGFTLAVNKLNKHATAVFSGEVPSAIEFLDPEKTIRKNTDSLRDFIISLDRDKADKLRYKVEDKVVRIFISPYRTAIKQEDLHFDQGDFNVDLVVALGVKEQKDLDEAITAHGRILHDATVATVNTSENGTVGTIHWQDTNASSLSEMLSSLTADLKEDLLDNQIATALLTGIVAETDRFSNDKTRPSTMAVSSKLMAAGANQQLVSAKLKEAEEKPPEPEAPPEPEEANEPENPENKDENDDGTLKIDHDELENAAQAESGGAAPDDEDDSDDHPIHIDDSGKLYNGGPPPDELKDALRPSSSDKKTDSPPQIIRKPQSAMLNDPPTNQDGMLTPGGGDNDDEGVVDPLADTARRNERILSHDGPADDEPEDEQKPDGDNSPDSTTAKPPEPEAPAPPTEPKAEEAPSEPTEQPLKAEPGPQTLTDIEKSVGAHQDKEEDKAPPQAEAAPQAPTDAPTASGTESGQPPELDQARQAILDAVHDEVPNSDKPQPPIQALNAQPVDLDLHPEDNNAQQQDQSRGQPPPVPPPMMPPTQENGNQQNNQQPPT